MKSPTVTMLLEYARRVRAMTARDVLNDLDAAGFPALRYGEDMDTESMQAIDRQNAATCVLLKAGWARDAVDGRSHDLASRALELAS